MKNHISNFYKRAMRGIAYAGICLMVLNSCDTQRQNVPVDVVEAPDLGENATQELASRRWKKTNLKDVTVFDFEAINGWELIAATSRGLYKSKDDGLSWEEMENDLPYAHQVNCLVKSEKVLFAGVAAYGIYKSTDEGYTWKKVNAGIMPSHKIIVRDLMSREGVVYAGTTRGLYVSFDLGDHWIEANEGFPMVKNVDDSLQRVTAVTTFLNDDKNILALTERGIALSDDEANTWVYPSHTGMTNTVGMSTMAKKKNMLFSGVYLKDGVYMSNDNGETWKKMGLQGMNMAKVYVSANGIIYAGTVGNGVYRSVNNCKDWVELNSGMPSATTVNTFSTSPHGKILAGTEDKGVFYLSK